MPKQTRWVTLSSLCSSRGMSSLGDINVVLRYGSCGHPVTKVRLRGSQLPTAEGKWVEGRSLRVLLSL